jgi:hypothetical protein
LVFYVKFCVSPDMVEVFVDAVSRFSELVDEPGFAEGCRRDDRCVRRRWKRLALIEKLLVRGEEIMVGKLFVAALRRGYGTTYRTFRRDIAELGLRGKIKTSVVRGGAKGRTTFVRLKQ